jgi:hypothetical protein
MGEVISYGKALERNYKEAVDVRKWLKGIGARLEIIADHLDKLPPAEQEDILLFATLCEYALAFNSLMARQKEDMGGEEEAMGFGQLAEALARRFADRAGIENIEI